MVFSCKYSDCKIQLSYEEKSTHEDLCLFKPYACPSPTGNNNCSWNGSLEEVMPHLLEHHKNIEVTKGRQVNVSLDLNKNARQIWAHIQACHGTWFLFMANREMKANDKEEFNALVQLVGSPKQAKKFNYELKLMKGNRKLIWISIPRSIHEGVQKAIADYDCLSFDRETAKLFISDDPDTGRQNTLFSVRITKRWF
jgi:E3 ubiquitin-protein ligase SIAH1